jgi:hypothetical protein
VAESKDAFSVGVGHHANTWRNARYADYRLAIKATLDLFDKGRTEGRDAVTVKELLTALRDDSDAMRYLQTTELVLPNDFWAPTHFVLDPTAAWILNPLR